MNKATFKGLAKAESHYNKANKLLSIRYYETSCVYSRRSVERALKTIIGSNGVAIPRGTDLEGLMDFIEIDGYEIPSDVAMSIGKLNEGYRQIKEYKYKVDQYYAQSLLRHATFILTWVTQGYFSKQTV